MSRRMALMILGYVVGICWWFYAVDSAAGLDCLDGTVPGWLDDAGEPTSCINDTPWVDLGPSDYPAPEPTQEPAPAPAPAATPVTADPTFTG